MGRLSRSDPRGRVGGLTVKRLLALAARGLTLLTALLVEKSRQKPRRRCRRRGELCRKREGSHAAVRSRSSSSRLLHPGLNSLDPIPNSSPNEFLLLPIGLDVLEVDSTPSESSRSSLQNGCVPSEKGERNRSHEEEELEPDEPDMNDDEDGWEVDEEAIAIGEVDEVDMAGSVGIRVRVESG